MGGRDGAFRYSGCGVVLSDEERETLQGWARRPKSARVLALRFRIVLASAQGLTNTAVGERWG